MVVQSSSSKNCILVCTSRLAACFLILTLAACATSAPPMPTDTTASNRQTSLSQSDFSEADLSKNCGDIEKEHKSNADKIANDNEAIKSNRRQNETAGYLGALVVVPLVALKTNADEKDDIIALQSRQDTILRLAAFKHCPTTF